MEYTNLRIVNSDIITGTSKLIKVDNGDTFVNDSTKGKVITSATKRTGTLGVKSKASFRFAVGDISTYTNKTVRLNIRYHLDYRGHELRDFKCDGIKSGRDDYSIAFSTVGQGVFSNAAAMGAFFVKAINKGFNAGNNPRFVATNENANTISNELVSFESVEPSIVIDNVELLTYESGVATLRETTTPSTAINDSDVFYVNQVEEFGTPKFITSNFRIITDESVRPYSLDADERPINGKLYTQYTIIYDTDRDDVTSGFPLGGIGKSRTTHVFYVNEDYVADWDTAFSDASVTLSTISR